MNPAVPTFHLLSSRTLGVPTVRLCPSPCLAACPSVKGSQPNPETSPEFSLTLWAQMPSISAAESTGFLPCSLEALCWSRGDITGGRGCLVLPHCPRGPRREPARGVADLPAGQQMSRLRPPAFHRALERSASSRPGRGRSGGGGAWERRPRLPEPAGWDRLVYSGGQRRAG